MESSVGLFPKTLKSEEVEALHRPSSSPGATARYRSVDRRSVFASYISIPSENASPRGNRDADDSASTESPCPSVPYLILVHILMVLSMALYAGNYVFFRVFNEHGHSAFLFSFIRTVFSIPFVPLVFMLDPTNRRRPSSPVLQVPSDADPTADFTTRLLSHSFEGNSQSFMWNKDAAFSKANISHNDCRELEHQRWRIFCVSEDAILPLAVASISGAVRQMIVPIALMFTSAANAGIIQPSVPVFTAFLSIGLGLERGNLHTCFGIAFAVVGLFLAGKGWDIQTIDKGFLLLLLVPISKGLQVIGLQYASRYERSSVLQTYQIIILIAIVIPLSTLVEVGSYCNWNTQTFFREFTRLDYISWLAALYSAISIILVCWRIQILGVSAIGSMGVSLYQAFQPIFAILLGWWILREPVQHVQVVGAVIVCVGLSIYQVGQLNEARRCKFKDSQSL